MTDQVDRAGGAISVSEPVAGFYETQLVMGGPRALIRLWYGPPHDPVTGEEMDRSWRWQALCNEDPIDFDRVWPKCAASPVDQEEVQRMTRRFRWAKENAPDSAYAKPWKKLDPLDQANPMPM